MDTLFPQTKCSRALFYETRYSWIWVILRFYLGYEWFFAGWEKFTNQGGVWVGEKAGVAVTGFFGAALKKTAEFCPPAPAACHPDVQWWYAYFLQHIALPHATLFSYIVTFGEIAVGIGMILGFMTGFAALGSVFMSFNFMLAGSVSTLPILFLLGMLMLPAWRVAGWFGLDRFFLPRLHAWHKKCCVNKKMPLVVHR